MGALHKGHAALIEQSQKENDTTFVSIFVNPLQFNNSSDYEHYPSTWDADQAFLEHLNVDALFIPSEQMMYPQKKRFALDTQHPAAKHAEGKHRPGHLNGVLTIVLKLLHCITPNKAYFGEKDFQQYRLIKAMAEDFFLDTHIIACPTVRETPHLPYSSRNLRLSDDEKRCAEHAFQLIHTTNQHTLPNVIEKLAETGIDLEYLEIIENRVYSAIKINAVRLIDNFPLGEKKAC